LLYFEKKNKGHEFKLFEEEFPDYDANKNKKVNDHVPS
jgi:hypothetical protein